MSKIILAEAAIDENGQTGYEGTKAGDQNGNEVRNINYYEYKRELKEQLVVTGDNV